MLARMSAERLIQPSAAAWDDAGALGGTLARTQGPAKGAHLTLVFDATARFDREQHVAFHGREPPVGWREATAADIHAAFGHENPGQAVWFRCSASASMNTRTLAERLRWLG